MAIPEEGTAITIGGFTVHELPGSGSVQLGAGGASGVRMFHCNWSDCVGFATVLKGRVYSDGRTPPNIIRIAPNSMPGYDLLYCNNVRVDGRGALSQAAGDGAAVYEWAYVEASYSPEQRSRDEEDEEEQVLATVDIDWQPEFLAYDKKGLRFKWATGSKLIASEAIQIGKLVNRVGITYTREHLNEIPLKTILNMIGKVNKAAWPVKAKAGQKYDPETLLFAGASSRKTINADGTTEYTLILKFVYHAGQTTDSDGKVTSEATWNKFFDPEENRWDNIRLSDSDDNYAVYGGVDFSDLFKQPEEQSGPPTFRYIE